jgi:hypothetical protein
MVGVEQKVKYGPDNFKRFLLEDGILFSGLTKEPRNYLNTLIDIAAARDDFCRSILPLDADWKDFLEYVSAGRFFPKYEISADGWGGPLPNEQELNAFLSTHPHTKSMKPKDSMESMNYRYLILRWKQNKEIHKGIGQLMGSDKSLHFPVERQVGGYDFRLDYDIEGPKTMLRLLTKRVFVTDNACYTVKCPYRQYIIK